MKQLLKTFIFAAVTIFFAFTLIKFPNDALEASIRGIDMWWEVVFPSLLPFFITAELLLSFGVVKFLGVVFEPIMRPLFNVPGVGSFAWIMGMVSGYPTGAKISVRLREQNQVTQVEAERLVAFTNASSPLFIFGAISIGFFHDPKLGVLLAICHYLGNAITGICMRFYGRKKDKPYQMNNGKFSIKRAFLAMHETRVNDKRPIGEILGDAVLNSIKTLVMVGGFIILFSVLNKMLFLIGLTPFIATIFQSVFHLIYLPIELALPFISGLFEITLGANLISKENIDPFLASVIVVSFILGFNGFSIQAQVASIISKSNIQFYPYFLARILHGIIASLLTIILYKPLYLDRKNINIEDMPVSNPATENNWINILLTLEQIGPLITILSFGIAFIILYRRQKKYK
ncbi:sporulation integral membrane protein YlbJ [Ornithinibacillus halotolerans]|uniref:Sporulation integral membrane protein YlbJ n=1 Tax=Ornithinibacillus halotolerans TaxID=1274357 RepID=A0A916S4H8_9BACI|nr:sporulation integral membrane protein YlbJ [Ornithinibacillus halotolerans]GGA83783.1 sporulation integral membrane protein YlbJ [Ornithinibacillus halotolerans]